MAWAEFRSAMNIGSPPSSGMNEFLPLVCVEKYRSVLCRGHLTGICFVNLGYVVAVFQLV